MTSLPSGITNTQDLAMMRSEAKQPTATREGEKLKEAAQAFEGLFLQQLMKAGRAASFGDALIDSSAVKTSQDLLDTELTQASSKSSGLGIAEAIYKQFSPQVVGRKY